MNEKISAKDYFERGNMSYKQGKYEEAIRDYKKALKTNPNGYSTWGNMGAAYEKIGNSEKAIECYLRSLKINPMYAEGWYNLGVVHRNLGNYEESIKCCQRALEINSNLSAAWYNLGIASGKLGRHKTAIECYRKAVSLSSLFEDAWLRIGEILMNLDDYEQARKIFQHVVDLNPNNNIAVKILVMLDEYYARSNHPEQYLSLPGKKNRNPREKEVDAELAELFGEELCEPSKPVNYEEKDIDPTDILAASKDLVLRGKGLKSQGDYIKALRLYNEALELNCLCWDAWKAKGDLFLEIGKTEEATFCYYKALYLALTPITGNQENDTFINESKYNQWRNTFFSTIENIHREAEDN